MKKISTFLFLTLMLLILLNIKCKAQNEGMDIVYLKNGSIIKGTITTYESGVAIQIKTLENYLWEIKMADIEKIEHTNKNVGQKVIPQVLPTSGFINYTSLGILAGNGNNQKNAPFSIIMSNGFILNKHLSLGLATGVEFFDESYLPVLLDVKFTNNKHNMAPFIGMQAGYAFAMEKKASQYDYYGRINKPMGGYLINPETGFIINFENHSAMYFSVGYRHQLLKYEEDQFDDAYINQYINRLSIRMGFIFR